MKTGFPFVNTRLLGTVTFFLTLLGAGNNLYVQELQTADIESLINQLGSPKLAEKDAAAKALLKIGEQALPTLKTALADSREPEFRKRCRDVHSRILTQIDADLDKLFTSRARFGLDVLATAFILKKQQLNDEDWVTIALMRRAIIRHAKMQSEPRQKHFGVFPFMRAQDLKDTDLREKKVVADSLVLNGSLEDVFLISKGFVKVDEAISGSTVFSNAGLMTGIISNSIIFSAGPVNASMVANSIVVSNGGISVR